jgi:hypothetical protein
MEYVTTVKGLERIAAKRKCLSGLTLIGITGLPASTRGPGCSVPSDPRVYMPMVPSSAFET